jgi:hypothetical protein
MVAPDAPSVAIELRDNLLKHGGEAGMNATAASTRSSKRSS